MIFLKCRRDYEDVAAASTETAPPELSMRVQGERELPAPQLWLLTEPGGLPLQVLLQQPLLVRGQPEQRGDGTGQVLGLEGQDECQIA